MQELCNTYEFRNLYVVICAYTEQVMREAEITESGAVIGGRLISNLRYADDTALCG